MWVAADEIDLKSMDKRVAVLDLGTNTFNLLIGEWVGGNINFLHRDKGWVYLAEDGMERISDNALQRMRDVLTRYQTVIAEHNPDTVVASGTAMFRRASNSEAARSMVKEFIGVEPNVISGDEEATLIYEGVRMTMNDMNDVVMVMDIGGGSTEFIIGKRDNILWKKSYALGATLLRHMFHKTEPITTIEREALEHYVLEQTADLKTAIKTFKPTCLIGASGSFSSFASMLSFPYKVDQTLVELNTAQLNDLVEKLYRLDETQRKEVPGLVWFRAGPIVTAAVLTQTIFKANNLTKVYRSTYALKEGLMQRLLSQ